MRKYCLFSTTSRTEIGLNISVLAHLGTVTYELNLARLMKGYEYEVHVSGNDYGGMREYY